MDYEFTIFGYYIYKKNLYMKLKFLILLLTLSTTLFGQKTKSNKFHWRDKIVAEPTGVWEFYNYEKELVQIYDFTNKNLIFHKTPPNSDTIMYKVILGIDTILTKLDRPPINIGGGAIWIKNLVSSMRYPAVARENNIQGKVYIAITINKDGVPINYSTKNVLGGGLEEEAIRVIKLLPYGWLPGIFNREKVTTEYIVPVTFALQFD